MVKFGNATLTKEKAMKRLMTGIFMLTSTALFAADAAFDAEKAKAMANPYANDLGPDTIDVSAYPAEHQAAYKNVLKVKCSKCHTAARPLNSQFFEPLGSKEEKVAKVAALQKSDPDMFTSKNVWQVEADIWQRYVKRMMAKPGCGITEAEGKSVYNFLRYDSAQRKAGKSKAAWKAHREKLLADFKVKYPERYKELYEGK
jgi:mono/diheme cytochrome c family protein